MRQLLHRGRLPRGVRDGGHTPRRRARLPHCQLEPPPDPIARRVQDPGLQTRPLWLASRNLRKALDERACDLLVGAVGRRRVRGSWERCRCQRAPRSRGAGTRCATLGSESVPMMPHLQRTRRPRDCARHAVQTHRRRGCQRSDPAPCSTLRLRAGVLRSHRSYSRVGLSGSRRQSLQCFG
jgi:hypothetical protein